MKFLILGVVLAISACATQPPEGSLARIKYDQRNAVVGDCMKSPERFGFPYTRAQNADLLSTDQSPDGASWNHVGKSPNSLFR